MHLKWPSLGEAEDDGVDSCRGDQASKQILEQSHDEAYAKFAAILGSIPSRLEAEQFPETRRYVPRLLLLRPDRQKAA